MAAQTETCTCARCGAATAFRDYAYQLPDCIWAQPAAKRSPRNNSDFSELGERRFVRGLLPVKVEDGEELRYGVWLEVGLATFEKVVTSWNDPERYARLWFVAKIANAMPPWCSKIFDAEVDVGVRDQTLRPFVVAARASWLQQILEHGWTANEYAAAAESFGHAGQVP